MCFISDSSNLQGKIVWVVVFELLVHYIDRINGKDTDYIMPNISKFNNVVASRIIELSGLGYNKTEICKALRIARSTLNMWIDKYNLAEPMQTADNDMVRGSIKRGLVALAEGAKTTENIREYTEEDSTGRIIKSTEKIRMLAPCEKAIKILSKKYAKEFSDAVHTDTDNAKHLTLDVNVNTLSLREVQDMRRTESVLDCVEAEATDITEESESLPPTKDSE